MPKKSVKSVRSTRASLPRRAKTKALIATIKKTASTINGYAKSAKRFKNDDTRRVTLEMAKDQTLTPNRLRNFDNFKEHLKDTVPGFCSPSQLNKSSNFLSPITKRSYWSTPNNRHYKPRKLAHVPGTDGTSLPKFNVLELLNVRSPSLKSEQTSLTQKSNSRRRLFSNPTSPLKVTAKGHRKLMPTAPTVGLSALHLELTPKESEGLGYVPSNKQAMNSYSAQDFFMHSVPHKEGNKELAHRIAKTFFKHFHIKTKNPDPALHKERTGIDFLMKFSSAPESLFLNAGPDPYTHIVGYNNHLRYESGIYANEINREFDPSNSQTAANLDPVMQQCNMADLLPEEAVIRIGKHILEKKLPQTIEIKRVILFDKDKSGTYYTRIPRNTFYFIKVDTMTFTYVNYPKSDVLPTQNARRVNNEIVQFLFNHPPQATQTLVPSMAKQEQTRNEATETKAVPRLQKLVPVAS